MKLTKLTVLGVCAALFLSRAAVAADDAPVVVVDKDKQDLLLNAGQEIYRFQRTIKN